MIPKSPSASTVGERRADAPAPPVRRIECAGPAEIATTRTKGRGRGVRESSNNAGRAKPTRAA